MPAHLSRGAAAHLSRAAATHLRRGSGTRGGGSGAVWLSAPNLCRGDVWVRIGGVGVDAGETVAAWGRGVRRVTVLTGAGISTDSGIPDFRGPRGVWTRNPGAERLATYQAYVSDPEVRRRAWRARGEHPAWGAEPNEAHVALARLAGSAVDTWVVTQNIDGLHQKAGTPADRVIEVHGSMFSAECVSCGERSPMAAALARVQAGEEDPDCRRCGGILKSATVMFGQRLDPGVFARAERAAAGCELFLAVGTTLSVEPAASLCALAAGAGAAVVIVNAGPTPYDGLAVEVIREPIGTAVPRIVGQLLDGAGQAPPGGAPPG